MIYHNQRMFHIACYTPVLFAKYYVLYQQSLLEEYKRVHAKIPSLLAVLIQPHEEKVDEAISPGLTVLRWTSVSVTSFVDTVKRKLRGLEILIDRANDILDKRIEGVLKSILATKLCDLPDNEPWTIEEFVNKAQVCVK